MASVMMMMATPQLPTTLWTLSMAQNSGSDRGVSKP